MHAFRLCSRVWFEPCLRVILEEALGADMTRSAYIGATVDEQDLCTPLALGQIDIHLNRVPEDQQRPADM